MKNEKYIDHEGNIAVLYSTAYGKPWTSHEQDKTVIETLLFDKKLVEMAMESADINSVLDYLEAKDIFICKDRSSKSLDLFLSKSCWESIKIKNIAKGKSFIISDYDGIEDVIVVDESAYSNIFFTA